MEKYTAVKMHGLQMNTALSESPKSQGVGIVRYRSLLTLSSLCEASVAGVQERERSSIWL